MFSLADIMKQSAFSDQKPNLDYTSMLVSWLGTNLLYILILIIASETDLR